MEKTIHLLSPMCRHVFPARLVNDLDQLYKALYPEPLITSLSAFYMRSGRAVVCGEILGSVLVTDLQPQSWPTGLKGVGLWQA